MSRAVSRNPASAELVSTSEVVGAVSWDGAIFFIRAGVADVISATTFLMRAICADWHVLEEAARTARRILAAAADDPQRRLQAVRRNMLRLYRTLAALEPTQLSYQESDIGLIEAVWLAWRRQGLHDRTSALLDRLERLYRFAADERQEAEAARQDLLNRGVAWLGVLGVAGTVAGVISSVDYSNAILTEWPRALWIGGSTLVTSSAFVYLLARSARLRKRYKDLE